jgi:hypothetical protein
MTVDGLANAVEEVDVSGRPVGPDNPYGNALVQEVTRLRTEGEAGRRCDASRGRTWRVISTEEVNRFGVPVSYTLYPEAAPALLADPASSLAARAGFAANHLWVTQYDPAQRYPAGDFVNQHPGGAGLPAFVAGDRDIDGTDIVLWHTFGPTHFPRPEEWPVMPAARCGFMLKPTGFFGRNPTLDVPPPGAHFPGAGAGDHRGGITMNVAAGLSRAPRRPRPGRAAGGRRELGPAVLASAGAWLLWPLGAAAACPHPGRGAGQRPAMRAAASNVAATDRRQMASTWSSVAPCARSHGTSNSGTGSQQSARLTPACGGAKQ